MNRWPIFSDLRALQVIMGALFVWVFIVGCNRPDTQPAGSSNAPVSVEPTHSQTVSPNPPCWWGMAILNDTECPYPPIATATLRSELR